MKTEAFGACLRRLSQITKIQHRNRNSKDFGQRHQHIFNDKTRLIIFIYKGFSLQTVTTCLKLKSLTKLFF